MPGIRNLSRVLLLAMVTTNPVGNVRAADLPDLPDTILYKKQAHDCHPVDLISWNHPTKQVLGKYHVQLFSMELCNSDKYPIFHVKFTYDPMGDTGSFFAPF
jgi:hypothetical protein